jgi:hypothetical protein
LVLVNETLTAERAVVNATSGDAAVAIPGIFIRISAGAGKRAGE